MKTMMTNIGGGDFRALFNYDPDTGIVTRAIPIGQTKAGAEVGTVNGRGYLIATVQRRIFQVSRLIWIMVNGAIPDGMLVDHINRDTTDNRLANLRLLDVSGNTHNSKAKTIYGKGVNKFRNRWRSYIKINGKTKHIGMFDTPEEASLAYNEVAFNHYGFAYTA